MSVILKPNEIENCDVLAVLIDDTSLFNLPVLQMLLGQEAESAKKWAKRHKVPSIKGRTWVFTGATARRAIEAHIIAGPEENGEA